MRADKKDAQALIDCGYAAYELQKAREAYDNRGARGGGFDGLPRQHGAARGLDDRLIKDQAATEKLHAKYAAFLRAQKKALRALDRLTAMQPQQGDYIKGMRAFLKLFYIDGLPMKTAWAEAGISERTARRYKAQILQAAREK